MAALLGTMAAVSLTGGDREPGGRTGYGVAGSRYRPALVSRYGAVASASPDASAAGISVLADGGNAVDAAVATAFAVGVAAQESCGLGGGGFLLYRGADGTEAVLDFRETAPAALPADFEAAPRRFRGSGHQVVGVPGTVAGMAAVAQRFGTRPLERLLRPAIALARRGLRLSPLQVEVLRGERERLVAYGEAGRLYLDDGAVPAPFPAGRERPQPDLAATLQTLADEGPQAFYRGTIGAAIVAEMERSRTAGLPEGERGVMTAEDLVSYEPVWREPLRGTYHGRTVLAVPPPTAGGIIVLEVLHLLQQFPLGRDPAFRHSTADHLHVLTEAKKIAVADRNAYVADPAFVDVPTTRLIAPEYADARRAGIDRQKAHDHPPGVFPGVSPWPPGGAARPGASTHHVSVVDSAGNAVAVTCSNEQRYGSGVVVPGTGVLLNNQLTDFDEPGSANEPRPGKRPRSNMSPVIVVDGGRPALVLGAPGGPRIPMGVVSVISNVVDFGMDPALAVDVARLDAEKCCTVELEADRVPPAERGELANRGHTITEQGEYHPQFTPLVQVTGIRPDGLRFSVSDPRYDRGAAVF